MANLLTFYRAASLTGMVAGLALLAGCATAPPRPAAPVEPPAAEVIAPISPGERIAQGALALVGRPYHYGGAGPDSFDCSGLVQFVHRGIGVETPRTTIDQYRAARPVDQNRLAAGDLLFFKLDGVRVSHVAIYVGDGRIVHAPQTGRTVEMRRLEETTLATRLAGVGQLW
jgi:cell wall-associated NlpC family hydrolase